MPTLMPFLLILCMATVWFIAGDSETSLSQLAGQVGYAEADAQSETGGHRLEVKSERDGHFYLTVAVNGSPIRFLVDTGASTVALTPSDAARAGISKGRLRFDKQVMTAAGPLAVANVEVREMRLDQRRVYGVDAVVLGQDGGISLLGMSFLRALDGYEVRQNRLVLHL